MADPEDLSASTFAPTPAPTPMDGSGGTGPTMDYASTNADTMDVLAAIFFVVAAGWLVIALLYSCLAVSFLRLRARGQLDSIYEEDFGRLYICPRLFGEGRFYLPLGCLLRRYVAHVQRDHHRGRRNRAGGDNSSEQQPVRFMTREERRSAMEFLLGKTVPGNSSSPESALEGRAPIGDDAPAPEEDEIDLEKGGDDAMDLEDALSGGTADGPVCSICLADYEERDDNVLLSRTCPHVFHRDCILDWLERNHNNAECPCCRIPMVDEEDVWETVKRSRRQQRQNQRDQQRRGRKKLRRHRSNEQRTATSAGNGESADAEQTEFSESEGHDAGGTTTTRGDDAEAAAVLAHSSTTESDETTDTPTTSS